MNIPISAALYLLIAMVKRSVKAPMRFSFISHQLISGCQLRVQSYVQGSCSNGKNPDSMVS